MEKEIKIIKNEIKKTFLESNEHIEAFMVEMIRKEGYIPKAVLIGEDIHEPVRDNDGFIRGFSWSETKIYHVTVMECVEENEYDVVFNLTPIAKNGNDITYGITMKVYEGEE